MPDTYPPSEFGGKPRRHGVQPPPHRPTASEKLSLIYRTGDDTGRTMPDNGESFDGLLPFKEQQELRKASGDLDKGQVWEEMLNTAEEGL